MSSYYHKNELFNVLCKGQCFGFIKNTENWIVIIHQYYVYSN